MTSAAANAVMDRLDADEELAQRLADAGTPEACLDILHAEGFDVTQDEMRDVLVDRFGDQLTQEQLDALSGGISEAEAFGFVLPAVIGLGFGAAAAAV